MACFVCTEHADPMLEMITKHAEAGPIRLGCACRGDGGAAHVGCMARAASMATDASWWACRTCNRMYTGKMRAYLASEYLEVASNGPRGPRHAAARMNIATVMRQSGQASDAEKIHKELLALEVGENGEATRVAIGLMKELAADTICIGDARGAVAIGTRLLSVCERVFGPRHAETIRARSDLAIVAYKGLDPTGRAEAERTLRVAIDDAIAVGADDALVMRVKCNLCSAFRASGRHTEARVAESEVLPTITRVFGSDHPSALRSRCSIATDLMREGRLEEAELSIRALVDDYERVIGGSHRSTIVASAILVVVLMNRNKGDDAEIVARCRAQIAIDALGATHTDAISARCCHAVAVCRAGRPVEAERELRSMLASASPGDTSNILSTIESVERMTSSTSGAPKHKRARTAP